MDGEWLFQIYRLHSILTSHVNIHDNLGGKVFLLLAVQLFPQYLTTDDHLTVNVGEEVQGPYAEKDNRDNLPLLEHCLRQS
ncbi:unnamed protein product [Schistosoma mattheei]|uniref:Uncharacterized protein n=1 Tax=Schistosoma mattheei TaxID=31246 RepID=A0A3P8EFH4_9TREM|nr:unnamed protein product [Schistosoma mattheei]